MPVIKCSSELKENGNTSLLKQSQKISIFFKWKKSAAVDRKESLPLRLIFGKIVKILKAYDAIETNFSAGKLSVMGKFE